MDATKSANLAYRLRGLGHVDRHEVAVALESQAKDIALLHELLQSRPAMNAALEYEYMRWTASVYDAMAAMSRPASNDATPTEPPKEQP